MAVTVRWALKAQWLISPEIRLPSCVLAWCRPHSYRQFLERSLDIGHAVHAPERPLSPGTANRHYAPQADVWLLDHGNAADELRRHIRTQSGGAVTAMLLTAVLDDVHGLATVIRMPSSAEAYARTL